MSTRLLHSPLFIRLLLIAAPLALLAFLWNVASWRPHPVGAPPTTSKINRFASIDGRPQTVAFSPDGQLLVVSREHIIEGRGWAYATNQNDLYTGFRWGKLARTIYAPKKSTTAQDVSSAIGVFRILQFSPDNQFLIGQSVNEDVAIISLRTGKQRGY